MAFPASGLFVATMVDAFDPTQLAVDLDAENHRCALFTDSITANLTTDTAYGVAPWNANEVAGTGYTAGGVLLTGTTFLHTSGGIIAFDATDISWTTATLSAIRGVLTYGDALAGNNALMAHNLGAAFAVTAGTFTVLWNASGLWTWDVNP